MQSSSVKLLYVATYVFVFIIAITVTIYIFSTVTDFAEKAYDFGAKKEEGAVTLATPTNRYRILNTTEVISYCYNYIIRDQYGEVVKEEQENNKKYNITIVDDKGKKMNITNSTDFSELTNFLGLNKQYIFIYESMSDTVSNITIRPASNEEIVAEF